MRATSGRLRRPSADARWGRRRGVRGRAIGHHLAPASVESSSHASAIAFHATERCARMRPFDRNSSAFRGSGRLQRAWSDARWGRPTEVPLGRSRCIRCIGMTCARDRRKLAQRRCRDEAEAIARRLLLPGLKATLHTAGPLSVRFQLSKPRKLVPRSGPSTPQVFSRSSCHLQAIRARASTRAEPLAMQKVEGSSPFSRFDERPAFAGLLCF